MNDEDEYDDEDEEDEEGMPFDFSKIFANPEKFFKNVDLNQIFNSKEGQRFFKDIIEQMMKNLPKEFQNMSWEELTREFMKNKDKFGFKGPIMYGFNVNFGPDGRPTIDSFGNIKRTPYTGKPKVKKVREPLVEVNEEETQIIVIAEMPGVSRDDIELKATSNSITISTNEGTTGRKYYKEVDLPSAINSNYAKARYQNGILEIKLKKEEEKASKIEVED